jgi:hypothetical protein
MSSIVRSVVYGVFAGGILALSIVAPQQIGAIAEEPVNVAVATIDKLFPEPVDPRMFRKYSIIFDDSISTDVQRTQTVRKIGHGRMSEVTIVTTPSGTYSTDGILSPHVRYPGIDKSLKRRSHDYWTFAPGGNDGGRWVSYTDGSFIYLSYRTRT